MCEKCQFEEFVSWPDSKPDNNDDNNDIAKDKEKKKKKKKDEQELVDRQVWGMKNLAALTAKEGGI